MKHDKLILAIITTDPVNNGEITYNNTLGRFRKRENGVVTDLAPSPGLLSLVAVTAAINTTETKMAQASIPANFLRAGSSFRITVYGTCTSTAANASNLRVRIGTAGTTVDVVAAVLTPTAAATGTNVPFRADLFVTIRTIGATGTMAGNGSLNNNGVTGVSAAAVVVGAPTNAVAINTTVANIIQVSYVSAAVSTTSIFQIANIELVQL